MKVVIVIVACIAVVAATGYKKSHYKESYHQEPSKYHHEPSHDYHGGHAEFHIHREPYGVHYDLNEHGPHGSSQSVSFQQKFGSLYEKPSYKEYH